MIPFLFSQTGFNALFFKVAFLWFQPVCQPTHNSHMNYSHLNTVETTIKMTSLYEDLRRGIYEMSSHASPSMTTLTLGRFTPPTRPGESLK